MNELTLFGLVRPETKSARLAQFPSLLEAQKAIGLVQVEHQKLAHRLRCAVALVDSANPAAGPPFFAIGKRLLTGPAVLYEIDWGGNTCDLAELPDIRWFDSLDEVERSQPMV